MVQPPPPSRPPLPTSETKASLSSSAPILCEKPDDTPSFLRGGGPGDHPHKDTHERRRWTHFALVAIVILFLGSCGGAALSGLLFWGIGVVDGIKVQWVAQSLVMFASITSLLYVILHIRAARLGRLLFACYNADHLQVAPTTSFKHTLQSRATLTIRAAVLFWTAATPAVGMGVYQDGQTILKLDTFVCAVGVVTTVFFAIILYMADDPFEVAVISPVYLKRRSRGGRSKNTTPPQGDPYQVQLESGHMRGGSGDEGGNKLSMSSTSSSDGAIWDGGRASLTPGNGTPQPPAPTYAGQVGGPRPVPGGPPGPVSGKSRRVLTRFSAIDVAIHPVPVSQPAAEQETPRPPVAGVTSNISSWIWPWGSNNNPTLQAGRVADGDVLPVSEPGGGRSPVSDVRKERMPGGW